MSELVVGPDNTFDRGCVGSFFGAQVRSGLVGTTTSESEKFPPKMTIFQIFAFG